MAKSNQTKGWLNKYDVPQAQEGIQTLSSRDKRGHKLLFKETKNAKKDEHEFMTTSQIKNPRSVTYKPKIKKQPEFIQDNRTDYEREYDAKKGQAKEAKKQFKKNILAPLDVVTDLMQIGNFVPHPIGQTIGKVGNILGSGIDAIQAVDDVSEGDYGSAAINAGSVFLPIGLDSKTFRRNSKYLQPGQPLYPFSPQANLPSGSVNIPRVQYIEPFSKVRGMTDTSLFANRALLGTLGAETTYDTAGAFFNAKQKNGGSLYNYNTQENYNDSNAFASKGFKGDGFSNIGRNYSPAWGGQFQIGGSIPGSTGFTYARTGSIPSEGKYAKKTLPSAQNGMDMYGNPMYAQENYVEGLERSNYDPRLNKINLGKDYNTWADKDKLKAHENYHAIQHAQERDNFDIAHNTENKQWAEMQKRPEMMSTDEVWNNFYNRKNIETNIDVNREAQNFPEAQFFLQAAGNIIANKIVDSNQYNNPSSLEGEAQFYEDTGKEFQNGGEMKYYQQGLDFQPKTISKNGSIIKDDMGQWKYPGQITEIGSNNITMQGVPYNVLGISDTGDTKLMKPGKNYKFKGNKVTEFPMAKNGINQQDEKTLQHLNQLTNFTNYNKPTNWLDKYN